MPLTRMKAEKSSPMAVSPTPKAALIWSLLPRTMYWSIPSTNRVSPTTHMGQLPITIRRVDVMGLDDLPDVPDVGDVGADSRVGSARVGSAGRSDACGISAVLTTGPPPVALSALGPAAPS